MRSNLGPAGLVFLATLGITYLTAIIARLRSRRGGSDEDLAGRHLNKWLVGLSAGTTGNSGFIVTAAVGLGYGGGVHWLLLPLSWLLGDLVFWAVFPDRLNKLAREAKATTISEALTFDLAGISAKLITVGVSLLLVIFLSAYTSAQWLAGKKFLAGVFSLSEFSALVVFALTIIIYSSLGGFRGSIYTDLVQAAIRIVGTIIALVAVTWYALVDIDAFSRNISKAGVDFLSFYPHATLSAVAGFVGGYACAAIGFGLGQPQIITRYFAGSSPAETKAAWWIYIAFLQFTWLAMTGFGVILRGVMPGIADPETGLSLFFQHNINAIVTGIIFADVFATIASTSNGILVAIAQTLRRDLFGTLTGIQRDSRFWSTATILAVGLATIILSLFLPGNVFSIAIGAVSQIGAGLAGAVMIKALFWRHTGFSLLMAIVAGISAASVWTYFGYADFFNIAGVGLAASLITNLVFARFGRRRSRTLLAEP